MGIRDSLRDSVSRTERDPVADQAVCDRADPGPWTLVYRECQWDHYLYREGYAQDGPVAAFLWTQDTPEPPESILRNLDFVRTAREALPHWLAVAQEERRLRLLAEAHRDQLTRLMEQQSELLNKVLEQSRKGVQLTKSSLEALERANQRRW